MPCIQIPGTLHIALQYVRLAVKLQPGSKISSQPYFRSVWKMGHAEQQTPFNL